MAAAQGGDYSGFMNAPDYLFARDQGLDAAKHHATAVGNYNSGGFAGDLAKLAAGYASQNYSNWAGRNMSLAQLGQGAAGQAGNYAMGAAQGISRGLQGIGDAAGERAGVNAGLGANLANIGGQYLPGLFGKSSYGSSAGSSYGTNAASPIAGDAWSKFGGPYG
jgi:hypothetical protein